MSRSLNILQSSSFLVDSILSSAYIFDTWTEPSVSLFMFLQIYIIRMSDLYSLLYDISQYFLKRGIDMSSSPSRKWHLALVSINSQSLSNSAPWLNADRQSSYAQFWNNKYPAYLWISWSSGDRVIYLCKSRKASLEFPSICKHLALSRYGFPNFSSRLMATVRSWTAWLKLPKMAKMSPRR